MSHEHTIQQAYVDYFQRQVRLNDTTHLAWLRERQTEAIHDFATHGFPTTRQEDWKYTNLRPLMRTYFQPVDTVSSHLSTAQLADYNFVGEAAYTIVFINGKLAHIFGTETLPTGSKIINLQQALCEDNNIDFFKQNCLQQNNSVSALNFALMQDGAFIKIARNTCLTAPIHLLFISDYPLAEAASHLCNVIVLEDGAYAQIIETYVSHNQQSYFHTIENHIVLQTQAQLTFHTLQNENKQSYQIQNTHIKQQQDSLYQHFVIDVGGRLIRREICSQLQQKGASCELYGLYLLHGKQHVDNHTRIEHQVPQTQSRELFKGTLDGQSHAVFNGKIVIAKNASQTQSVQENHNLNLVHQFSYVVQLVLHPAKR
jgi:Fe-S cluster assembly protein SufD